MSLVLNVLNNSLFISLLSHNLVHTVLNNFYFRSVSLLKFIFSFSFRSFFNLKILILVFILVKRMEIVFIFVLVTKIALCHPVD